jgi:hypothetical protein
MPENGFPQQELTTRIFGFSAAKAGVLPPQNMTNEATAIGINLMDRFMCLLLSFGFHVQLTPKLSCVACLPARLGTFHSGDHLTLSVRADMQACHVCCSALLGSP